MSEWRHGMMMDMGLEQHGRSGFKIILNGQHTEKHGITGIGIGSAALNKLNESGMGLICRH
jgi:hypothetical protein